VFGLLCASGWLIKFDLSSVGSLLLGGAIAFLLSAISMPFFDLDIETVCAACAASWLMLSLVCYHRDFLRDLPNSFEDDAHWNKAVAVGALKVYFDLLTIVIIVLQARWIRDSIAQLTEKDPKN
jgi:FtsH-binding integral membrane protein